jgi:hypothetical protein
MIVSLLLDRGTNVQTLGSKGRNPLQLAEKGGRTGVMEFT